MGMTGRRALWTAHIKSNRKPRVQAIKTDMAPFTGTVLGIDPSLRGSGFSVIEASPMHTIRLLDSLTLKLGASKSFTECLGEIFLTTQQFLKEYPITAVAVEQTIYVQNVRTAHVLGSARGACLSAVALAQLPVQEFTPLRIKKSITGRGQATKQQVSQMVMQLLHLLRPLPYDESDASAAALCYCFSSKGLSYV